MGLFDRVNWTECYLYSFRCHAVIHVTSTLQVVYLVMLVLPLQSVTTLHVNYT
ncbi:hypothetical protein QE331_gp062 [Pseudomonas phage 20Sep416]|uniref:Uncharacterized protein n=2 Tax=Pakpunavirus TaxID=1921407 RepID=A0AAF0FH02_9CAUD|nr:hypothetical protein QE331_gp062 [Pseudomonas phage 20Sep416]WFG37557.1 hypothetical protein 20Sep416_00062 [Pseudomonas phage 20Sep416]